MKAEPVPSVIWTVRWTRLVPTLWTKPPRVTGKPAEGPARGPFKRTRRTPAGPLDVHDYLSAVVRGAVRTGGVTSALKRNL